MLCNRGQQWRLHKKIVECVKLLESSSCKANQLG